MIEIDYVNHPQKTLVELLKFYDQGTVFVLDDILASDDSFQMVFQDLIDILKYKIESEDIRKWPIHFIFHHGESTFIDDVHVMGLNHFLSSLCLWYAYMRTEQVELMDESSLIDWEGKNAEDIAQYIDTHILEKGIDIPLEEVSVIVSEIIYFIRAISEAFGILFGFSASIYGIMVIEESNPEVHELMYAPFDPNMQIRELEDAARSRNKRLMEILRSTPSDFQPLLNSGKNLSENQMKEIFICMGFKSNQANQTIPWFMDANILITGIYKPSYYVIDAEAARDAQIKSRLDMAKPGALSKKMNHNATPIVLRQDNEMCDSARPLYITIKDEAFLKGMHGRYYYDERGDMCVLNAKTDTDLIGKTLPFRSPCTCTSKKGICRYCYGELYHNNKDLFSAGSLAATKASEKSGQAQLSLKHSQETHSDELKFDEIFYKTFDMYSSEVTLSDNPEVDLDQLLFELGPVKIEEGDDGDTYKIDWLNIKDFDGNVLGHVQEEHGYPLYLSKDMVTLWKQAAGRPIPVSRINEMDDDVVLFNIEVNSKEVTDSLNYIMAILDSKDHLGFAHDLDGFCQKYDEIMYNAGIKYPFVHFEMITRALLRKKGNEFEYPDFSANGDHTDYEIMRLTGSLRKNPSPVIRLCTGWLKSSLLSTSFYQAHEPSHFDPLLVPNLNDVIDER